MISTGTTGTNTTGTNTTGTNTTSTGTNTTGTNTTGTNTTSTSSTGTNTTGTNTTSTSSTGTNTTGTTSTGTNTISTGVGAEGSIGVAGKNILLEALLESERVERVTDVLFLAAHCTLISKGLLPLTGATATATAAAGAGDATATAAGGGAATATAAAGGGAATAGGGAATAGGGAATAGGGGAVHNRSLQCHKDPITGSTMLSILQPNWNSMSDTGVYTAAYAPVCNTGADNTAAEIILKTDVIGEVFVISTYHSDKPEDVKTLKTPLSTVVDAASADASSTAIFNRIKNLDAFSKQILELVTPSMMSAPAVLHTPLLSQEQQYSTGTAIHNQRIGDPLVPHGLPQRRGLEPGLIMGPRHPIFGGHDNLIGMGIRHDPYGPFLGCDGEPDPDHAVLPGVPTRGQFRGSGPFGGGAFGGGAFGGGAFGGGLF